MSDMLYVILCFAAIALIDVPPLIRERRKKELIVFGILFIFAFIIALLHALDIRLPSPQQGIDDLLRRLGLSWT